MKDAVAVVLEKNGKFLLIKRAKKGEAENYWCPITGAVEPGETQAQAVIREAEEEMGLDVKPLKKIWQCYTEDKQYLIHWWSAEQLNATITPDPAEVKEYCWVTFTEMQQLDKMFKADLFFFKKNADGIV